MSPFRILLCGALLVTISGNVAHAGYVAFDNIANDSGANDAATTSANWGFGPLGQSFTTSSSGTIDSIGLMLGNGGSDGGSIVITVTSDSSNAPGSAIFSTTVSDSLISGASSLFTLSNLNIAEVAGTQYWIVISDAYPDTSPTNVTWDLAGDATSNGSIGASGEYVMAGGVISPDDASDPLVMQVNAPEPATLAVLGIGIAGLGWARGRRKPAASKV